MAIYEMTPEAIVSVAETRFDVERLKERSDLQRLLRDQIGVIAADTMVIAEEFASWEDSRRRIDLLALDRSGGLVVIELKRDSDGGLMDLQAIRYAAMVSAMTFEQAVAAHASYLDARGLDGDAEERLLEFLGWEEPDEDAFAKQSRIVLVAADFSKELTTAVLWLNERDLDVRCVRVKPYTWQGCVLLDVQQVIPLPEAAEYQIQVREKARRERAQRRDGRDFTKYNVGIDGDIEYRLAKRRAMYRIVRALCERGVSPEQIGEVLAWRGSGLWRVADGDVDSTEFVRQLGATATSGGLAFEEGRWYCADEELVRHSGKTYALTKMWGIQTEEGMNYLLEWFPGHGITLEVSAE